MSNVIKIGVVIGRVAERMRVAEGSRAFFQSCGAKDFTPHERKEKANARQMSMLVYAMGLEFTATPAAK